MCREAQVTLIELNRFAAYWRRLAAEAFGLDISVSGQFLLEVLVSNLTCLELAAEIAGGLADGCACCSWRLERH